MDIITKKKRAVNWSNEEKEILRQLIGQSKDIIEDKSTKTSINHYKNKEWKNITIKLTELTGKDRAEKDIRLAWKRMKLAAKSNISKHRREQSRTGGGEKPPSPSPEDLEVVAIAPYDFVVEFNDFDSDAVTVMPTPTTTEQYYPSGPTTQKESNAGPSTEFTDCITIDDNFESNEGSKIDEQVLSRNKSRGQKRSAAKKEKNSIDGTQEMRKSIINSNIEFKIKKIQMMEEEHEYNKRIAELNIKKLELEIAILELQYKKNA